ncbi:hypothetical protein ACO2Q9_02855 [Variovorax sp. VNK109]|uniref:DUF7210 family protein n=1 Tax=Variovorax sp. VNK109 TaxID=3400919 RepID=UPI003C00B5B8
MATAAPKTFSVKAKTPVEHSGQRYEPGSDIGELTEKQADALVDVGAAEDKKAEK